MLHLGVCKQAVSEVQGSESAARVFVYEGDNVLAQDSVGSDADLQQGKWMELQDFMQGYVEEVDADVLLHKGKAVLLSE